MTDAQAIEFSIEEVLRDTLAETEVPPSHPDSTPSYPHQVYYACGIKNHQSPL